MKLNTYLKMKWLQVLSIILAFLVAPLMSSCKPPPSEKGASQEAEKESEEAKEGVEGEEAGEVAQEAVKKKEESMDAADEEQRAKREGKSGGGESFSHAPSGVRKR